MTGIVLKYFKKIFDYICFLLILLNHLQTHNNLRLQRIYCILIPDLIILQSVFKVTPLVHWQLQKLKKNELLSLTIAPAKANKL